MLTEAEAERKASEEQERMRQHVRDCARIKARHDAIRRHKTEFRGEAARARSEGLSQAYRNEAHEIACAGKEVSGQASRTEHAMAAYEVADIEACPDALPALVATALAALRRAGLGRVETSRPKP
jgi:hypothetical protein